MTNAVTGPIALDARAIPYRRTVLLVVTSFAALVFLSFLGSNRTLTRHEVIVAQPALNMLADGNWIVPRYNTDEPWVDKPPLVSWLDAAFFAVTGFNEWSARLPAALSAIGLSLLVTLLALRFEGGPGGGAQGESSSTNSRSSRKWFQSPALYAGLAQASAVYAYLQGRLGEIDMPFALVIAGAHAALVWQWGTGATKLPLRNAVLFHTLAGVAVLAKGPLAVAFLGCGVAGFCAARRSWRPLAAVLFTPAILCFLVVAGWWYVAAYQQIGHLALERWSWTYVNRIMGEHVQGRQSALVYLASIPWLMLPWSITLVVGFSQLRRTISRADAYFERYLWCWFFFGLVPLFASQFKHKHYAIPLFPPLAILAGQVIAAHVRNWHSFGKVAYSAIFGGMLLGFLIVGGVVMGKRDPRSDTVDFARNISRQVPPGEKLVLVGLAQSAVFPYLTCEWRGTNKLDELDAILKHADGKPVWVLTQRQYLLLPQAKGLAFQELAAETARQKPIRTALDVHVFGRIVGGTLDLSGDVDDVDDAGD